MTLSRHSSRVYMDAYDVDGTLNVLRKRIEQDDDNKDVYLGAHLALNLIRNHDHIDSQREFMQLFDSVIKRKDI